MIEHGSPYLHYFVKDTPDLTRICGGVKLLERVARLMRELSGLWALLPVIVWQEMHLGALGYGLLLGCIGVGAVLGAAALSQVQRKIPIIDQQVIISTIALALVMIALGYLRNLLVLCLIATVGGIAWIMLVSSFGWFLARDPSDVLSHHSQSAPVWTSS